MLTEAERDEKANELARIRYGLALRVDAVKRERQRRIARRDRLAFMLGFGIFALLCAPVALL